MQPPESKWHRKSFLSNLWPKSELTVWRDPSNECDDRTLMQLETKFLRLRTPVTLGSRFGDWEVCWLGGWNKHRFGFMVMVVRVCPQLAPRDRAVLHRQ